MAGRLLSLSLFLLLLVAEAAKAELCDVTVPQAAIILDLPESVGNDTSQHTSPSSLPLEGVADGADADIELTLSSEGQQHFQLTGKTLRLLHPVDRDERDLLTLRFTVSCRALSGSVQRSVPVVVRLLDINDNVPQFEGAPYRVTVPESAAVGTTIFTGMRAADADAGPNGQIRYSLLPGDGSPSDGSLLLSIPLPHRGHVVVTRPLDYEAAPVMVLRVQAADNAASNQQTSVTTLTVTLQDSDDQDPLFVAGSCRANGGSCGRSPEYRASVVAGERAGVLDVLPDRILAIDQDSLGASVRYTLSHGSPPSYSQFFTLHPQTGALSQVAPVPRGLTHHFQLTVTAEEETPRRGNVTAPLTIIVTTPDSAVPVLRASGRAGAVRENAVPGTAVRTPDGEPVTLSVTDPDLLPGETPPTYRFELTTGAFRVSPDGVLQVAVGGLDRDPPSPHKHTFQVVAREMKSPSGEDKRGAASAPLTLTVELEDDNDNAPRFPVYPPVGLAAGGTHTAIAKVVAHDPDEGPNGAVTYELTEVTGTGGEERSGGGIGKFRVDADTGEVFLLGSVAAGQQYALHVTARDGGGQTGSTRLDVLVGRGPNTGGPYFPRRRYSSTLPENTNPGTSVLRLTAVDPDGDTPRYSLHPVMSPTDPHHQQEREDLPFQVDPLNGELVLAAALDRETRDHYTMIVTAEDAEGLRGSVTVDVSVTDINDVAPLFQGLPYSFRVEEGRAGVVLGAVKAIDPDAGRAGEVQYSVPSSGPLSVGELNGTLYTREELDYERQQVHYVVVTASDLGHPPLSSTTTLTLLVGDVSDEPPLFSQLKYEAQVPENSPVGSLVTTVEAVDKDTNPSVTYQVRGNGGGGLFAVHPQTGRVTVAGVVDRELAGEYVLTIGTVENVETGPRAECTLTITVLDANDAAPALPPLPPVLVRRGLEAGTVLLSAPGVQDGDATAPNNEVHYSLVTEAPLAGYLAIDSSTGTVTLQGDLSLLNTTEITVEVVARDGGSPPRSSSSPLRLLVEVEGAPPPALPRPPPTFARSKVLVTLKEDAPVGSTVARVGIIHPPSHPLCHLEGDAASSHYHAELTPSGDCVLLLTAPLDADGQNSSGAGMLTLTLLTKEGTEDRDPPKAKIIITVEDVNDNSPRFLLNEVLIEHEDAEVALDSDYHTDEGVDEGDDADGVADEDASVRTGLRRKTHNTFVIDDTSLLVVISDDAKVGTTVAELQARDPDSGPNAALRYTLLPVTNRGGYFAVAGAGGRLITARPLVGVPATLNPFNLTVVAQDNPVGGRSNSGELRVLVNVIGGAHRLVVPLDAPTVVVTQRREDIQRATSGRQDALVVLERIVPASSFPHSPKGARGGSEVWLVLLDPRTGHLLPKTHPRVNRVMSQSSSSPGSLLSQVVGALGEIPGESLRGISRPPPKSPASPPHYSVLGGSSLSGGGPEDLVVVVPGLRLGLLVVALVILVLGLTAIVYVCIHWARAVRARDSIVLPPLLRVPVMPPPAPPSTLTDTLHKKYEVQVLHMSVPQDDDSLKGTTPPRSAHNYFMDNVSYISKNNPMADDSRSDSISPYAALQTSTSPTGYRGSEGRHYVPRDDYGDSSDDMSDHRGDLSHSATNHNVMFGRGRPRTLGNGSSHDRSGLPEDTLEGYTRFGEEGGRRHGTGGEVNREFEREEDDGIIGYGFEGAGIGGPVAPILDLSPVRTTTLL